MQFRLCDKVNDPKSWALAFVVPIAMLFTGGVVQEAACHRGHQPVGFASQTVIIRHKAQFVEWMGMPLTESPGLSGDASDGNRTDCTPWILKIRNSQRAWCPFQFPARAIRFRYPRHRPKLLQIHRASQDLNDSDSTLVEGTTTSCLANLGRIWSIEACPLICASLAK